MRRFRHWVVVLCVLAASGWAEAQSGGPNAASGAAADSAKALAFDVISVKPADSSSMRGGIRLTADGFAMSNIRVDMLLNEGFQLGPNELIGEPDWAKSQGWDINAKVAGEDVAALSNMSFDDRRQMFVQVLAERFGLKYHTEHRELPVYALVVAKGGPKMTESKQEPDVKNVGKGGPGKLMGSLGHITAESTTTEFLANMLSRQVGHKVVDKTGLTGHYDFNLTWAPEQGGGGPDAGEKGMMRGPGGGPGGPGGTAPGGASDPGSGASVFTAVQEQLGLKLEPQKATVNVVVIDHLEKPSEN
jgi:uncharacterized protein (TIGR03435 family)